MKPTLRIWTLPSVTFLVFLAMAWALGRFLGLQGVELWVLRSVLVLLGLVATFLVHRIAARSAKRRSAEDALDAVDDEVDRLVAEARRRLGRSAGAGTTSLGKLPVVLFLGPTGSTKTSAVVNSGLDPELLAGEAQRGDSVVPTPALNLWYCREAVFLEAGGRLLDDRSRWGRVLRHVQPRRLAAVLGRGAQAPRAAVVCFGCDELLAPGAAESVPAAARALRARLAELAGALGVRIPVYVLFTKADRLPYFQDYVRNLAGAEAHEVLGATLPVAGAGGEGTYAEAQTRRLDGAFQDLFRSLASRRIDFLARESDGSVKAGLYEFPRELRKVTDLAVRFLVDLVRPSQLAVSPVLRGFYFTGVRPIVLSDPGPSGAAFSPGPGRDVPVGATTVFDPRTLQAPASPAPSASGGRRVPQWVFLQRIFGDLVLGDRVAAQLTAGGVRVNLLRRAAMITVLAALGVLVLGTTVSWVNNRRLTRDVVAAVRGVEPVAAATGGEAPSLDDLRRLDALRERAALLGRYEREGRPWRMAWGLYRGGRLHADARRAYFARFRGALWEDARTALAGRLDALPDAPDGTREYGEVYDELKAYLITTSHPHESTADFLTPVLEGRWLGGRELDPERQELVRRQFDFYAAELPFGNPYGVAPGSERVARAREFLSRFAEGDRLYQTLLASAAGSGQPVRFGQQFPGSTSILRNDFVVPAAFTAGGWQAIQQALGDLDRLLSSEDWVAGERVITPQDRSRLARELRERYVADYVRHWVEYLRAGSVAPFTSLPDAAQKLAWLGGNQSPILQMVSLASRNTTVDSALVGRAFQPAHAMVPPDAERYIVESTQPYIQGLAGLQAALEQAAAASGPTRDMALGQAAQNAAQARRSVQLVTQAFDVDGDARLVGSTLERLLQAPISSAEGLVTRLPAAEVNQKGASFCQRFGQVTARYPFSASGREEATVDDVVAVFQPGSSLLWTFYDDALQNLLVQQGARWERRVGAVPQPSSRFVEFFNRAAAVSGALFRADGAGPEVSFALRPQTSDALPEVMVSIDGQTQRFTRTQAAAQPFRWEGARAREVRITGLVDGSEQVLLEATGTWGLFRLFQGGQWQSAGDGRYTVRWSLPGRPFPLTVELTLAGRAPVFRADFLGGLGCVAQIAG